MLGLGDALGLPWGSSYPGSTTNLTGCTEACRNCEYVPEKIQFFLSRGTTIIFISGDKECRDKSIIHLFAYFKS